MYFCLVASLWFWYFCREQNQEFKTALMTSFTLLLIPHFVQERPWIIFWKNFSILLKHVFFYVLFCFAQEFCHIFFFIFSFWFEIFIFGIFSIFLFYFKAFLIIFFYILVLVLSFIFLFFLFLFFWLFLAMFLYSFSCAGLSWYFLFRYCLLDPGCI